MRVPALLCLLFVAGCGSSDTSIEDAKAVVAEKFVDPASAQFRNIRAHPRNKPTETVCGEVNAKNRMGGYVGFHRFVYLTDEKTATVEPSDYVDSSLTSSEFIKLQSYNCEPVSQLGSRASAAKAADRFFK